jgi:hypothetical protein
LQGKWAQADSSFYAINFAAACWFEDWGLACWLMACCVDHCQVLALM